MRLLLAVGVVLVVLVVAALAACGTAMPTRPVAATPSCVVVDTVVFVDAGMTDTLFATGCCQCPSA